MGNSENNKHEMYGIAREVSQEAYRDLIASYQGNIDKGIRELIEQQTELTKEFREFRESKIELVHKYDLLTETLNREMALAYGLAQDNKELTQILDVKLTALGIKSSESLTESNTKQMAALAAQKEDYTSKIKTVSDIVIGNVTFIKMVTGIASVVFTAAMGFVYHTASENDELWTEIVALRRHVDSNVLDVFSKMDSSLESLQEIPKALNARTEKVEEFLEEFGEGHRD